MSGVALQLFNYFRSSASFRVRIALELKGLAYDYVPVHLRKNEQFEASFTELNPAHLVPLLKDGQHTLTQSIAIIEYLDETRPEPPLLPPDAPSRARVRALAFDVACEIHPLNNLRVLRYLTHDLQIDELGKTTWYRHWVEDGLAAIEARLAGSSSTGLCCHGDTPTLADIVLVPQIFNARAMDCRLDHVPTVRRIVDHCMSLDAFVKAQPSACPDAAA